MLAYGRARRGGGTAPRTVASSALGPHPLTRAFVFGIGFGFRACVSGYGLDYIYSFGRVSSVYQQCHILK